MKKILTGVNVQALVLFLISVAETVFMALYKPFGAPMIVLLQIVSLIGIAFVRFASNIAYFRNYLHSAFYRRNAGADDEPSGLAVFLAKLAGYVIYAIPVLLMFL